MQTTDRNASEREDTPDWPSVTLLVLSWNGRELLESCLPSLLRLNYGEYEVAVVDNGSTDGTAGYVRTHFPSVRLIETGENLGFSRGINYGLRRVTGEVVVLLNNDITVLDPDWLHHLVHPMRAEARVGVTGGKLLFPDEETIQHAGADLIRPLAYSHHLGYGEKDTGQYDTAQEVPYITGAAMAIARPVMEDIGLLDEAFHPIYYEEVDFCWRARAAGYQVRYVPEAVALHDESFTLRQDARFHSYTFHRNRLRFVLKHYDPREFLDEFVPAEKVRLAEAELPQDLYASRRAYLDAALTLPPGAPSAYRPALLGLRIHALAQEARRKPASSGERGRLLAEMDAGHALQEPEFQSEAAVVGPLIASFRETWNNVSTKWYVRPLIQQQQQFNHLVIRLLHELMAEQHGQTQNNSQEIQLLLESLLAWQQQATVGQTEVMEKLAALEQRLEQLEASIGQDSSA